MHKSVQLDTFSQSELALDQNIEHMSILEAPPMFPLSQYPLSKDNHYLPSKITD